MRRLGLCAALLLPAAVWAAPVINTPTTSFTAAESGRTFMTVGDVWNGSAKVGSTTGDTFSVTYTNSGDATAYDLALSVALPTGFSYVSGTATVSTSPATPGLTVSASQVGTQLTFTLTLAGTAYDLPAGSSITINYGLTTATTVASGTYQPTYSSNYSLTNGGLLVGAATTQQNILVKAGDTTVNVTPKQQTKAVGDTAGFIVTVTNTGLGGIFNVTIDESSIYPLGNNLQFASLTKTAPALAATSSNGGSVLTLPYLAPGDSFTATVDATVLSCGSIVNNVTSVHLANQTPVSDSAPVQLDLKQPLVAYTTPTVALDYNVPVTVTIPVNNTGLGAAYNFKLQSTVNTLPVTVTNVASGWTYNSGTGLFTYTAGTIANGGSATLTFDIAPTNVCSASGAGTINYVANYANGCGDAYTIPQQSQSVTAATNTPSISLGQTVSATRIAILDSGTYTLTLSAANLANISTSTIVVTETLPASITYVSSTPSAGTVGVVGQVVTWTVPKAALSTTQTLGIDFSVNNDPCNAGTQPTATATTSATSVQSCPLSASAGATFFISNNPGLAASQYFNVTTAPDGLYETGNASADLVRDAGEGEFIPFVASYTFGSAYPGTWSGSTYDDAFGSVTGMVLVPGSLTVTGTFGTVAVPSGAITNLSPGFRIDLSFLAGASYFNDPNVANHTVAFNYQTTAPDSAVNPGSTRAVTQVTNFILAGAGGTTSGGCNTPTKSTFTQGAFYTIGRAAAGVAIGMNGALEVCKPETLTLTVSNTDAKDARNILVTLQNSTSDFTYNPSQTPVYGGSFTSGNITYNANGGSNPTFTYTGNPLTANGTIQVTVTPKATGSTTLAGFSAKVAYDSAQTQAAGSRVYNSTASYSPSSVKKATLAVTVTPGSLTVTGPTISYITYVSNTDAGTAYGATVANTLPTGITINTTATNAANPGYPVTVAGQNLTWALGDLASGATVPITVVADVGVIPGCSLSITTERITATWGCDTNIYSTVTKVPPSFVFPAGKMQVVHDSTQTVARLCDLGKIVVVVKNTGPTNIQGVVVSDVVPPSAGLSISGTVQYRVNGGSLQNTLSAPTGDGSSGNPYVWTSAQIPELAQLVPVGVSGTNQINIEFGLAATETLASQNPVLSASATATISCGNAVSSPAQPFTIPIERPSITVTKTGRNITATPAGSFGSTVYGGYQDDVEWKIIVANNGTATASNVRLSDQLSGSGGTAVINGPGLATDTPFTSGQVITIPDIAANGTATYTITEVLGNNCLTASRNADVTWGCTSNGATTRSNVSTPGSPTGAATIAMTPVIVSGTELTQTVTNLPGGRAKITVNFTNNGGTAYAPVVTATIPSGSTFDSTGTVTFTSGNASITGVTTGGTSTSPIFTFTGPASPLLVRYGESVTVSYYVRSTVFDTTSASTFPNLAGPETTGNGLDPSPPAAGNLSAKLDYTNSCGAATSQTNTISYDPLTPDLDINLTYPGDVLLTGTTARNYVFTITNNGDAGSVANFINLDLPGLGSGWTINSITLTTAGTGGTSGATISAGGAFTPAQVGTLAQGSSAVVTVNAQYSGTPGPLTMHLRARGEARGQDGTTAYGDYSLDQGGIRVVGVTVTKALQATSESATTGSNVLIGEEATFRITASFFGTEGDITSLDIRDTPANSSGSATGLAYVSNTYTGANQITPDAVTVGGAAPAPVAAPTSSSNSRIDFTVATLAAATVNAGTNTFQSDVVVRVLNIAGNTDNLTLTNNLGVSFTYLGQTFRSNNSNDALSGTTTSAGLHASATLSVRRPAPVIVKTVRNVTRSGTFATSAPGQAGDVIEYKIVITNPVGAERPLYDLSVSDTVPAKLNLSASNAGADTDGNLTTIEVANTAGTSGLGATLAFNQTNTALPAAGSNFTRLDPGNTITLLYRGTVDATVTPTEVLSNNASLLGYSLPLPSGSQTTPLGTENTATGPTRYSLSATAATVVVDNITQTKTLVATSDPSSSGNNVFVGEQIHYQLVVQLPQGTIPDLVVRDSLPSGLALVSTPVVTIGSAITSTTQPTITPSSLPSSGNPLQVQWAFGGRTVASDTVVNRTITIDYFAQVQNVAANVAGTSLANNASFSFTGTGGTFTAITPVTVTVQAPAVAVARGARNITRNAAGSFVTSIASGSVNSPDAGDILEYQITITNPTATNVSSAFDFNIVDTLPAGLTYVPGSATVTTATGVTGPAVGALAPDVSGQVLTWGRTQSTPVNIDLAPAGSLVLRYRATVADSATPVQTFTDAIVVDWTSLDGNPVTNPDLGVALLAPGNTLGERIGTGTAPNTYRSALNVPIITLNNTAVVKVKSGDTLPRTSADALGASPSGFRIGDLITYTVTATAQEGTLNPFKIIDVLPAGLAFYDTVSITPATGTVPFTYTTPVAGTTAPSAGATGTLTWNFGSLVNTGDNLANDTLVLVYRARVVDPSGIAVTPTTKSLSNSATVSYQKADASVSTTTASVAAITANQPQLTLTKVVASPAADALGNYVRRPGDTASFTLTVTNTGNAPAYNIKLTDTLPDGMRDTAPVLSAATINGAADLAGFTSSATWTAGTGAYVFDLTDAQLLLPGQTLVLTYTATVDSDGVPAIKGTTLTNTATINQFFSLPSGNSEAASRRQYAAVGPVTTPIVIGLRIDGSVYNDADVSNSKNGAEDWSGATKPTVYANLVTTIAGNPAVFRTVTVNPTNGTFFFDYLPPVAYTIVVTNSATATTALRPANWLFQFPTTGSLAASLVGATADLTAQDLGLSQGSYAAPIIAKAKSGATLPTAAPVNGYRIGDLVTYTVDINPQEGALTSFTVTDTLPAGLAYDTSVATTYAQVSGTSRYTYTTPVAGSTAPANGATGTLTWTFGNFTNAISGPVNNSTPSAIAAGNTLRITYHARVIATGTGNIAAPAVSPATTDSLGLVNSAAVAYTNPAPISAAASAGPATVSLDVSQPRLTVAKVLLSPALNRIAPGGTGQFQVTITNDGTAPAYNIRLTDTLPSGMRGTAPSLVSTTIDGSAVTVTPVWTAGTGTYVFNLSDAQVLQPGKAFVATYTFTVDSGATRGATLTNSAVVNQYFSLASADTQAASRRTYAAVGPATASVIVGIQISGFVYNDANANNAKDTGEDWSGATKPTVYVNLLQAGAVVSSATVNPGTGAFSFTNLPAGTYDLIATDSATSTTATRPTNWPFQSPSNGTIASIALTNADVSAQNFGFYQGTLATALITKAESGDTLSPSGFRVGDLVTYTIDLQPQEGALTSFAVTDALPAGLAFDSTVSIAQLTGTSRYTYTTPAGGNTPASGATGTLTWNFGAFTNAPNGAANNTLRIVYTARVINTGTGNLAVPGVSPAVTSATLTNSAGLSYVNPASATITAGPASSPVTVAQPRLTVSKVLATPALNRMAPGDAGTFTVTVANNGTAPAYDLILTDTLPVGLRGTAPVVTSATLNGSSVTLVPTWDNTTGAYVFTLADAQPVNAGQSLVVTYSFAVDLTATRAATLTNAATLTEFYSKPSTDTTERRKYTPGLSSGASVIVGLAISGSVYQDLQPNNAKDGAEDWTGAPVVYVNLVNTTGNTVTASATINPGNGLYSFTNLPAANYKLIVATTATATTPSRPANWPFQNPSNGTLALGAVSTDLTANDFGLYHAALATAEIAKSRTTGTLPLSAPADGYRIGDLVTYTVDVNPQEGALTSFKVTDVLPAGLAFYDTVSITPASGGRYTYTTPAGGNTPAANATGTVVWNFGAFTNALNGPASNTLSITYRARVIDTGTGNLAAPAASPATTTSALVNSATITYVDADSNNVAAGPATTSLNVEQARLTLAKTRLLPVASNLVRPGDPASFRLTLTNDGTAPAYNVSVKDVLPVGMRGTTPVLTAATLNGTDILATLNAPGWNSATGAWTLALVDAQFNVGGQTEYILPGDTLVLDYTVTLDAGATKGATLDNSATVEAYYSKPDTDTTQRRQYALVGPSVQPIVVGLAISGFVYNDLSPNGVKDSFEDWLTGTPVYVNLVDAGTSTVLASASVPVGNGAYSFPNVAPGSYRLVLTNASGNPVAAAPATWLFRAPIDGSLTITPSNADLTAQNFGLFRGRTLSGRVFSDTGAGGGTANDGRHNGTEPGLGNVTVRLLDSGLSELATARTDGAGNFVLSIPVTTATGATLIVEETNPTGYTSTGGYGGTTGGTYDRTTDRLTFTYADDDPTGVEFGDVPVSIFTTDGQQFIQPGATALYRHTFVAGTAGTVTFSTAATATPSLPWTQILVRDTGCDGTPGAVISGPITVTAGQEICLLVKDTSTLGAPNGATNTTTLTATFSATVASTTLFTTTLLRQDVSTIGTATTAGLTLVKSVDKTIAAPGEVITYTIVYTNNGAAPLNTLFIEDRTPQYTVMSQAIVAETLPTSLTGVSITQPAVGATGAIRWDFTGTLDSGASGTVTFKVKVQ